MGGPFGQQQFNPWMNGFQGYNNPMMNQFPGMMPQYRSL